MLLIKIIVAAVMMSVLPLYTHVDDQSDSNSEILNESSGFYKSIQQDEFIQTIDEKTTSERSAISPNTNFVNYDLSNQKLSFEFFDETEYAKRDSIPGNTNAISTSSISPSSITDRPLEQVVNAHQSPYLPTAKILMTYRNVYNYRNHRYYTHQYVGTAFLEGPNLAVSAGHCMYDDVTDSGDFQDNRFNPCFPDKVEFFFGCSNQNDFDSGSDYIYYAQGKTISLEYDYYLNTSWSHDWSAIVLDRNIGTQIGWYGKISNYRTNGSSIYSWGYPTNQNVGTLWKTEGTIHSSTEYKLYYDLSTYGGQSGSPIFVDYSDGNTYVCGIHTNSFKSSDFQYNSGTMFNSLIFSYLNSFFIGGTSSGMPEYYLDLATDDKSNAKKMQITNNTSHYRLVEYNTKLCMPDDARQWKNLKDIETISLKPYESKVVSISNNWFASAVAVSFCTEKYRYITYWYKFKENPPMKVRIPL